MKVLPHGKLEIGITEQDLEVYLPISWITTTCSHMHAHTYTPVHINLYSIPYLDTSGRSGYFHAT